MGGDSQYDIHFVTDQGMLLWQPILGQIGKNKLTPSSFITLAFQNGLEHRNTYMLLAEIDR